MPLYEYHCEDCGRRSEILQRLDEPAATECPHCQGRLRKLLSAPAFQFKGTGWYLTDYARKGGGGSASDATGSTGEPDGSKKAESGAKETGSSGAEKATSAPVDKPASTSGD